MGIRPRSSGAKPGRSSSPRPYWWWRPPRGCQTSRAALVDSPVGAAVVTIVVAGAVVVSPVGAAVVATVVAGAVVVSSVGAAVVATVVAGAVVVTIVVTVVAGAVVVAPVVTAVVFAGPPGRSDRRGDAPGEKDEQQGEAEDPDGRLHGNDYYYCRYLKQLQTPATLHPLSDCSLFVCAQAGIPNPPGVCGRRCPGRSAQRDRGSDRLGRVVFPLCHPSTSTMPNRAGSSYRDDRVHESARAPETV